MKSCFGIRLGHDLSIEHAAGLGRACEREVGGSAVAVGIIQANKQHRQRHVQSLQPRHIDHEDPAARNKVRICSRTYTPTRAHEPEGDKSTRPFSLPVFRKTMYKHYVQKLQRMMPECAARHGTGSKRATWRHVARCWPAQHSTSPSPHFLERCTRIFIGQLIWLVLAETFG
jgi:hypothetical protein